VYFTVPNRDVPRGITIDPDKMKERSPYELECEVVQSLAKWKRLMLDRLGCDVGEGIYCDSISIRKGYKGDVTHSIVADQWDFEVRINEEDRTVETLKQYVTKIWKIVTDCEDYILEKYPDILLEGHPTATSRLPKKLTFITSEELHEMFPTLGVHERETAAVKWFGAIFIIGMGWPMADGTPAEEVRSPGYDDWHLNGDIIVEVSIFVKRALICNVLQQKVYVRFSSRYIQTFALLINVPKQHPLTQYRHELMSTGIRVNSESLRAQLAHRGMSEQAELPFMKAVLEDRLPFCFGGGIGISRLLMLLLRTCHIGEVQCGVWHDEHYKQAAAAGIDLIPDRIVDI
jgi:aspartate--ammonia ligase